MWTPQRSKICLAGGTKFPYKRVSVAYIHVCIHAKIYTYK